ncbi:uncharacterized protein LOC108674424 [Hyalella azteca]|uniref:Uncharacterized protein LOC108674424 n=1 Tax=Hyalella azteca TaxID=294128 RepID=A0A979FWP9_HYAAZ|nr:uncharacterized protein LOC108674424 [Hyalella azteca]
MEDRSARPRPEAVWATPRKRLLRYTKVNRSLKTQDWVNNSAHVVRSASEITDPEKPTFLFNTAPEISKSDDNNIDRLDSELQYKSLPPNFTAEAEIGAESSLAPQETRRSSEDDSSQQLQQKDESCEVLIDESEDNTDASSTNTVGKCSGYSCSTAVHISFELSDDKGVARECSQDTVADVGRRIGSLGESRSLGPAFFSRSAESYPLNPESKSQSYGAYNAYGKGTSRRYKLSFREDSSDAGPWGDRRLAIEEEIGGERQRYGEDAGAEGRCFSGFRPKGIQLRLIPRGSTERYTPKLQPAQSFLQPSQTFLQPTQSYPRIPCSPHHTSGPRPHSQRRGSSPQAPPQILYGSVVLRAPHSAQSSPPGPRSPRLGVMADGWSGSSLKTRRSSGEMEWLAAPGFPGLPRSRKNSWSSVSTDCDFSPCWEDGSHSHIRQTRR